MTDLHVTELQRLGQLHDACQEMLERREEMLGRALAKLQAALGLALGSQEWADVIREVAGTEGGGSDGEQQADEASAGPPPDPSRAEASRPGLAVIPPEQREHPWDRHGDYDG